MDELEQDDRDEHAEDPEPRLRLSRDEKPQASPPTRIASTYSVAPVSSCIGLAPYEPYR
jgi:hypothetical protein